MDISSTQKPDNILITLSNLQSRCIIDWDEKRSREIEDGWDYENNISHGCDEWIKDEGWI